MTANGVSSSTTMQHSAPKVSIIFNHCDRFLHLHPLTASSSCFLTTWMSQPRLNDEDFSPNVLPAVKEADEQGDRAPRRSCCHQVASSPKTMLPTAALGFDLNSTMGSKSGVSPMSPKSPSWMAWAESFGAPEPREWDSEIHEQSQWPVEPCGPLHLCLWKPHHAKPSKASYPWSSSCPYARSCQ